MKLPEIFLGEQAVRRGLLVSEVTVVRLTLCRSCAKRTDLVPNVTTAPMAAAV
jgi:hypothetical protein